MLIFVIAFNLSLTVLNLYVAYRLWRWRQYLIRATLTLERLEGYCDRILNPAPELIFKGRSGSHRLRQFHLQLGQCLAQLNLIRGLVGIGVRFRPRPQKSR
jgi:hypothetical protein